MTKKNFKPFTDFELWLTACHVITVIFEQSLFMRAAISNAEQSTSGTQIPMSQALQNYRISARDYQGFWRNSRLCDATRQTIQKQKLAFAWFIMKHEGSLTEPRKSFRKFEIQQHWISAWSVPPSLPCGFFKQQHGLNFSGLTSHWAGVLCPFLSACHVTECNVAFLCNGLRHVMPMTCQPGEFQRDTVQWKTWFSNCPGGFKP